MRFEFQLAYGEWPYDIVVMAINEDEEIIAASLTRVSEDKRFVEIHIPDSEGGSCTILSNGHCNLYLLSSERIEEEYPDHMELEHQVAYLFGLLAQNLPVAAVAEIVHLQQPV
ncbi:MAG: hypothetical protein P8Y17_02305 [Patescibacteria group bacterium]|jgi:hypothetical protein